MSKELVLVLQKPVSIDAIRTFLSRDYLVSRKIDGLEEELEELNVRMRDDVFVGVIEVDSSPKGRLEAMFSAQGKNPDSFRYFWVRIPDVAKLNEMIGKLPQIHEAWIYRIDHSILFPAEEYLERARQGLGWEEIIK